MNTTEQHFYQSTVTAVPDSQTYKSSMNPFILFLSQLFPLLIFIIVDSIVDDVRISILTAVIFAIIQLIFTYIKTHRFEWLVLIDVALIAVLGGVSIAVKNAIFFMVKPAVIEGAGIIFFVVLILAPDWFLLRYFQRMMPGMALKPQALGLMKSMLILICIFTAFHIGAVLYTAFYSSREAWAFVSGPGFYLMILPMGAVMWFRMRMGLKSQQSSPMEP